MSSQENPGDEPAVRQPAQDCWHVRVWQRPWLSSQDEDQEKDQNQDGQDQAQAMTACATELTGLIIWKSYKPEK